MYMVGSCPRFRQRMAVVRVHDRTLVLGISEESISTLAELTPKPAAGQDQKEDG
jgi:flagellar biogenesis protein FliO